MLDIKLIREDPTTVERALATRGAEIDRQIRLLRSFGAEINDRQQTDAAFSTERGCE